MRGSKPASLSRNPRGAKGAGVGWAPGHFGEIVQGRLGAKGPVALVTLTTPATGGGARFDPAPHPAPLMTRGDGAIRVAARALRAAASALGGPAPAGRLSLTVGAPLGGGAGASTVSAVAAIRAWADAFGHTPGDAEIARACLIAEGAVDPVMFEAPGRLIWASRRAEALGATAPAPRFELVGGFDGPGAPTDPVDDAFADVADLVEALVAARATGDVRAEAEIASESARRNQARNPKPRWSALTEIGREAGALGVAVAHTGSAAALLFAPGSDGAEPAAAALRAAGLARVAQFRSG